MKKLGIVVLVGLLTLALAELSMKLFYDRPWVGGYSYNYFTGTILSAGTTGWWTREGRGYVSINSDGMRDNRDYELNHDEDTFRVAIIGDSYVEAIQVDVKETFWRILENELNSSCLNQKVKHFEILPFGVSGHGPAQYLQSIKNRVLKYEPNLIMVVFTPGNDFRNSLEELEDDPMRPYLIENLEGVDYSWDMSFRNEPFSQSRRVSPTLFQEIRKKSTLVAVIDEIQIRIRSKITESKNTSKPSANQTNKTVELGDDYMYLKYDELPENWKKSRRVVKEVVSRMGDLSKSGTKIIGVIGTAGTQIYPDQNVRRDFAKHIGVNDLLEPSRFFSKILIEAGLDYVDLYSELSKKSLQTKTGMHGSPPDWSGHWNIKGHKQVAKILGFHLCRTFNSSPRD